jgi:hypothetical protein
MGIGQSCCNPYTYNDIENSKELPKRIFTLTKDNFYEHQYLYNKKISKNI